MGGSVGKELLVVVNPGGSGTVKLDKLPADGKVNTASGQKYRNVFSPEQVAYTGFENGQVYLYFNGLTVDGGSLALFAHENNLLPWDSDLGVALCKNGTVTGGADSSFIMI